MAAGLGSRYGGNKQVDGVGPNNEILMEYSIYDAIRAGFSKVVFIIKPEMEGLMHRLCGDYLTKKVAKGGTPFEVAYAFQDFLSVPNFYKTPAERTKPFGTVHALLCAADVVHEPFCVINADDYYGIGAYQTAYDALQRMPGTGKAAMVGYLLKNTVSLYGSVTRGICSVKNGMLEAVKETPQINCKYHIVFAPKYRRKVFYGEKRREIGEILRTLCNWKRIRIIEAEVCPDHVHMLVEIPPKVAVSSFIGYLKGKSSLMIYEKYPELRYKYRNREFWCRGYYVDTVGKNAKKIEEYIRHQLDEDKAGEQLTMFDASCERQTYRMLSQFGLLPHIVDGIFEVMEADLFGNMGLTIQPQTHSSIDCTNTV